jgi:hypothetical protein
MKPLFDICEAICICDIIDNNNSMSSTIITGSNCSKAFLTSSVPLHKFEGKKMIRKKKTARSLTICNLIVFESKSMVRIFYEIEMRGGGRREKRRL